MSSNIKNINFLERCPHLKSEWVEITAPEADNCYQHAFSDDQSEAKFWRSVPMKEVDIYSSREAYSFPFCPKIYKYIIEKNQQCGNRICFDLTVLFQRIINRLSNTFVRNATTQQIKFLASRVDDIVRGFQYLYKRFGAFHITKEMIGWTELGIIKVWMNEDFSLNKKGFQISKMEDMVKSLTKILQECSLVKNKIISKCSTFESLLKNIKFPHERKASEIVKQVAFKPVQNLNLTLNNFSEKLQEDKINEDAKSVSKKNITFSYSNKYINSKSSCNVRPHAHKRSSIKIDEDPKNTSIFNRLSVNCNDSSVVHKSPTSSLKIIYPQNRRHLTAVVSHFYKENNEEKEQSNRIEIKRLQDHFCKTTVSSTKLKDFQSKQLISHSFNAHKPETLHYSTSSNPCAKFMNLAATMGKTYSTNEGNLYQNMEEQQILKIPKRESNLSEFNDGGIRGRQQGKFQKMTVKIEQKEQQGCMRQSQEIQRDLDALFHSDHDFDYGELQNQLDCIL